MKSVAAPTAALALCSIYAVALADTYTVTFEWTDPTTYCEASVSECVDDPYYQAKYRVDGGDETLIDNLATPSGAFSVEAAPDQTIEVAGRVINASLESPWTDWVMSSASAPGAAPSFSPFIRVQ